MKLKVTNTETGEFWIEENENHSWENLCHDAGLTGPPHHLCWCDLECLVLIPNGWAMLDECGAWAYLPERYKVQML
jgi:hypothetical protein